MKKLLSLILAAVLLLSLAGCGQAQAPASSTQGDTVPVQDSGGFQAGYAKVNITPEDSVPLGGYGNSLNRMSNGFLDYIYATGLAMSDAEGNTVVVLGVDMGGSGGVIRSVREQVAQELNLPLDNVVISASHMHSFPDLTLEHVAITRYIPVLTEGLLKCAQKAVEDLAPAQMMITSAETSGLNFVRRYELAGGVFVGYESDITELGLPIVGHETEADPTLQLVKFDREEDKTDILLANFQVHPHRGAGSSSNVITADLVGAFRDEVTNKLGYDVIYITGAAGNLNPYSAIASENITADFKEQGIALAQYAIAADSTYTPAKSGKVQTVRMGFEGEVDHSSDHLLAVATEAKAYYQQTNSVAAMRARYLELGIHSSGHANMIINRSSKGAWPFDIWAISVGDVAFAVAPYEMFDTNGMFIKENSPFAMTVITTCANGGYGYLPSKLATEHGGYEADNTYYVPGSAEKLADMYVQMLQQLHGE